MLKNQFIKFNIYDEEIIGISLLIMWIVYMKCLINYCWQSNSLLKKSIDILN